MFRVAFIIGVVLSGPPLAVAQPLNFELSFDLGYKLTAEGEALCKRLGIQDQCNEEAVFDASRATTDESLWFDHYVDSIDPPIANPCLDPIVFAVNQRGSKLRICHVDRSADIAFDPAKVSNWAERAAGKERKTLTDHGLEQALMRHIAKEP